MILLLGGTSESREVAEILCANGYRVMYSSTTGIIDNLPKSMFHRIGPLSKNSFMELLQQYPITCIIDATHPFAVEISRLAISVADISGIPCIRFDRSRNVYDMDDSTIITVNSLGEAASAAGEISGGILSTLGTRMLPQLCGELKERRTDLAARVLPLAKSITECERCGIPASRIIAVQGPFDKAFNCWCISHFNCTVMLSKESGDRAGFGEKVSACRETGCILIIISRPEIDSLTKCVTTDQCLGLLVSMGCQ